MVRNAVFFVVFVMGFVALFGAMSDDALNWALAGDAAAPAAVPAGIDRAVDPGSAVASGGNAIVADGNGHYRATVLVNGNAVGMIIDTGASQVVLTQNDARLVGIALSDSQYTGSATTAAGQIAVAPIVLDRISVNGVERRGVPAVVSRGPGLPASLLGQSYLNRLSEVRIANGQLTLRD